MRRFVTERARRTARTVAVVGLLLAAGCGEVGRMVFTPPRAEFRGVSVRQLGLAGGTLDVYLQLTNPNGYALTATGARYQLFAHDSIEVGRGQSTDTVRIAAHDSATVRLPLDLSWGALQRAGVDVLRSGGATYRIEGDVDVKTPLGTYPVPLRARGEARIVVGQ